MIQAVESESERRVVELGEVGRCGCGCGAVRYWHWERAWSVARRRKTSLKSMCSSSCWLFHLLLSVPYHLQLWLSLLPCAWLVLVMEYRGCGDNAVRAGFLMNGFAAHMHGEFWHAGVRACLLVVRNYTSPCEVLCTIRRERSCAADCKASSTRSTRSPDTPVILNTPSRSIPAAPAT